MTETDRVRETDSGIQRHKDRWSINGLTIVAKTVTVYKRKD